MRYALNVAGEDTWAYYYTGFPIVRIRAAVVIGWPTQVRGAHALAVADDRVALVGGYGKRHRLVVGSIQGGAFSVDRLARLVMPTGDRYPGRRLCWVEASELHVVVGQSWLKLGLKDLAT